MNLKALVISAFESHELWPAWRMKEIACSIVAYFIEKSGAGMMLLMLGINEP